jgi:hypothetical protein
VKCLAELYPLSVLLSVFSKDSFAVDWVTTWEQETRGKSTAFRVAIQSANTSKSSSTLLAIGLLPKTATARDQETARTQKKRNYSMQPGKPKGCNTKNAMLLLLDRLYVYHDFYMAPSDYWSCCLRLWRSFFWAASQHDYHRYYRCASRHTDSR